MVLLSGGIDSATCLRLLKKEYDVRALTFEYAGISAGEIRSAREIAREAEVEDHRIVRLPDLKEAQEIAGAKFEGMPPTYIPMRNGIFYFFAASFAEEVRASAVAGGHNKDDLRIFRDVSPEFFAALQDAFWSGSKILKSNKTKIIRPLQRMTKVQVVKEAATLGVPLELTWSCHKDGSLHCWDCGGCRVRIDSFRRAGVPDPLMPVAKRKIT